jgi:hypothetical protein
MGRRTGEAYHDPDRRDGLQGNQSFGKEERIQCGWQGSVRNGSAALSTMDRKNHPCEHSGTGGAVSRRCWLRT